MNSASTTIVQPVNLEVFCDAIRDEGYVPRDKIDSDSLEGSEMAIDVEFKYMYGEIHGSDRKAYIVTLGGIVLCNGHYLLATCNAPRANFSENVLSDVLAPDNEMAGPCTKD